MAKLILQDFLSSNDHILGKMQVNIDLYGKCNFAGVHEEEQNPVPNFEIKNRKRNFYDADEEFKITEIEMKKEAW